MFVDSDVENIRLDLLATRHTIPLPVKQKFYTQYTFHSSNQISMEIILKRFMNFVSTSKFSHHEMKVNMAAL